MTEERRYLFKAIAAIEDARAYLLRLKQTGQHDAAGTTLSNCVAEIMRIHDACAGLLKEIR